MMSLEHSAIYLIPLREQIFFYYDKVLASLNIPLLKVHVRDFRH